MSFVVSKLLSNPNVTKAGRSCLIKRSYCQPPPGLLELEAVKTHQNNKRTLLIDVREAGELQAHGIVPGAIHIPVGEVPAAFAMDSQDFEAKIGVKKPDVDDPLIFFCVKGIRAKNAKDLVAEKFQYKQSFYYPGSFAHLQ